MQDAWHTAWLPGGSSCGRPAVKKKKRVACCWYLYTVCVVGSDAPQCSMQCVAVLQLHAGGARAVGARREARFCLVCQGAGGRLRVASRAGSSAWSQLLLTQRCRALPGEVLQLCSVRHMHAAGVGRWWGEPCIAWLHRSCVRGGHAYSVGTWHVACTRARLHAVWGIEGRLGAPRRGPNSFAAVRGA